MVKVSNNSLAGAVGAAVTAAGTWVVGTIGGLSGFLLGTEQIWFPLIAAYNRFIAPKYGVLPKLGSLFLAVFALYAVGRALDLKNDDDT